MSVCRRSAKIVQASILADLSLIMTAILVEVILGWDSETVKNRSEMALHPMWCVAGELGFEPRLGDPESPVLPLHHSPMYQASIRSNSFLPWPDFKKFSRFLASENVRNSSRKINRHGIRPLV